MKKVFVSGCYDILHGGHVEFFSQAKTFGDYLVVSVAGDEVLWKHKQRKPSIPAEHKTRLLQSLKMIDEVVIGNDDEIGLDFKSEFLRIKPQVLVVTEDDKYEDKKRALCQEVGAEYIKLPKTLNYEKVSTTEIVNLIKAPAEVPLRVDFGGGWLDVPKLAVSGGFIVNCAITPLVSLKKWDYHQGGGLGGSAAYSILMGNDSIQTELDMGVGWQDPAIIKETGLCVWQSGPKPVLEIKRNPEILKGKMALLWTGQDHYTPSKTNLERDYELIYQAGKICKAGVYHKSYVKLFYGINLSYQVQLKEGMEPLPSIANARAWKYCGGGWGGYAVYLFDNETHRNESKLIPIEPYLQ